MKEAQQSNSQVHWWLGVADLITTGLHQGAVTVERVHISIADETFNVLEKIPVTRPVSEPVRLVHHGISRLSYRSVAGCGWLLNQVVRRERT